MAKFAFCNIPLHAHINPTLPIVQELVARGDQVIYYLTERYRGAIEATGATFRGYPSKIEQSAREAPDTLTTLTVEECLLTMPQMLESVRMEQPDCIVYDPMCLSGRFIAQVLHIPAVISRPTFVAHEQGRRTFQARGPEPAAMQRFRAATEELCSRYSLPPFDVMDIFQHKEALNVVYIPRSFQPQSESLGDEYLFVGPSIGARCEVSDFPFARLGTRPVVYITLGTVYNNSPDFFKTCFAALADQPWQVVVATGRPVDELHLGPIPENFLVQHYVPQSDVLRYASVFVGHGGMTTFMESISQGVPMVVIPQAPSQVASARRVAELKLGIVLEKTAVTAESLREAVTTLMNDPLFRSRVQRMQEDARLAGGFQKAAEALQDFVRCRV
ncbi:MAG TPA: macrolide family glycosyltransferase [Ktedonobacteraceae bacterium]|jgi:MGT family glycosyltransferase|nr:macrolide family glycosyltransferase [Ktedonobacteraceae bacterium]